MLHGRISLNSASAAASEFCEWIQVGIDVCIPHRKYQVKPHSSPWLTAVCAAAILHKKIFLFESKIKFRQASDR